MKSIAILLGTAVCALAAPAAASTDAASIEQAAAMLQPSAWVWQDNSGSGPLNVIVSLADQRAYVFRGNQMIAVSSAATGRDGKETPTGIFPILQKQVHHKSTLYDSAPMPYMERLTWDGVAIHGGSTPGYRNSHGCIHVPLAFAKKLYAATRIGTVVEVTKGSVVPTDPSMLPPDPKVDASDTARANAAALKTSETGDQPAAPQPQPSPAPLPTSS